jgi:uncharacterized protein (TIGR03437 family)
LFTAQVIDAADAVATKQFSLTITGTVSISQNGIVNAASYFGGGVAPGEFVAIFGSGLGPATPVGLQLDSRGYVSNALAGVQVTFDGVPAPIILVSAKQVNVVVPYAVSGNAATQLQVSYAGQKSNVVTIPVTTSVPGIFTANSSGSGQGAIVNQNGTVNSVLNPAAVGSFVFVYGTGGRPNQPRRHRWEAWRFTGSNHKDSAGDCVGGRNRCGGTVCRRCSWTSRRSLAGECAYPWRFDERRPCPDPADSGGASFATKRQCYGEFRRLDGDRRGLSGKLALGFGRTERKGSIRRPHSPSTVPIACHWLAIRGRLLQGPKVDGSDMEFRRGAIWMPPLEPLRSAASSCKLESSGTDFHADSVVGEVYQ